ncbi:MAG: hypothetical protein NTW29_11560 [Bacteroidetes bacterium]|nr:hypothetical protein [Bacteroidota bacterium]
MKLIYQISHGWSTLKFLQVGIGGLILYTSAGEGQIPGILLGSLFTFAALVGNGQCCMGNACHTGAADTNTKVITTTETEYEELDADK